MAEFLHGYGVGDWVTISEEVEGSFCVGRYAGEMGCITEIDPKAAYPFLVGFGDDKEWRFTHDEFSLFINQEVDIQMDEPLADWEKEILEEAAKQDSQDVTFGMRFGGDAVNHPSHYADGWSHGAEVIDITENLNFNRGNAVKYIARAGKKDQDRELEDLRKAVWYINREIARLGG